MSRRDRYHQIVRDALEDEGWTITHDPYYFETDPVLSTDLGAERTLAAERGNEKIAVEVKSFLRGSQVVVLEQAIGQYFLYEEFLKIQEPERSCIWPSRHTLTKIFSLAKLDSLPCRS